VTAPAVRNNATRALDAQKIAYVATAYSPDLHTASEIANAIGAPLPQVFKTLVTLPDAPTGRPTLVVIPGTKELDLKALASALGEKKLRMASHQEAEKLTGLKVGGISALALLAKNWRVVLDDTALVYDQIYVSGGQRGLNLCLSPTDFQSVTHAVPVTLP
jgi:Cys-tRNA(Pro)/Cys-tRNA(Cys) deacylase